MCMCCRGTNYVCSVYSILGVLLRSVVLDHETLVSTVERRGRDRENVGKHGKVLKETSLWTKTKK